MTFNKGYIYHIFNQGNNKQKIFFNRDNYIFFLNKIKTYILPYADIFAWCLMPNHFHLMVLVNFEELVIEEIDRMTPSHPINATKTRSFNNSIAILLRSYTRAINKQRKRSGSLFKAHTKAECVNCNNGIAPPFINDTESNSTLINSKNPEKQYPQICFNYIHQNPVKANLVKFAVDWEFSSAADYYAGRNGKIIKRDLVAEYLDIPGKFE